MEVVGDGMGKVTMGWRAGEEAGGGAAAMGGFAE